MINIKDELAEQQKKFLEFMSLPLPLDYVSKQEQAVRDRYPGVPEPHYFTWEYTDDNASSNVERKSALLDASLALERAASVCKALAFKDTDMTVAELTEYKKRLSEAVHKGEDQIVELQYKYPMPTSYWYQSTKEHSEIGKYIPTLLTNTEERILFWLPPLPAKTFSTNSLIFEEFMDVLHSHDFPRLGQWHCDFFHVYKEDNLFGVRDVDNYPYKPIIDALSRALYSKDSFDNFSCSMFNVPSKNLRPGCYIDVRKRSQKVGILADFENCVSGLTWA